jgi:hypothetical protein
LVEIVFRIGFGGPEQRVLDLADQIDLFFLDERITDPEAQRAGLAYLKKVWLEDGTPLFERRYPVAVEGFREVLGPQAATIPHDELGLIIDTAVQRLRAWAAVLQMDTAGADWLETFAIMREGTSVTCRAMHKKLISVPTAAEEVRYHMGLAPEGLRRHLEQTQARMEEAALAGDLPTMIRLRRALPPYHVGCRTRVKMAL